MTSKTPEIAGFHAHIYYDAASRSSAVMLREMLMKSVPAGVRIYPPIDRPVGPHPTPMFEVDFSAEQFHAVVTQIMLGHGEHSVLVHPITGDDLKDHFNHAIWIGKTLPLDRSGL